MSDIENDSLEPNEELKWKSTQLNPDYLMLSKSLKLIDSYNFDVTNKDPQHREIVQLLYIPSLLKQLYWNKGILKILQSGNKDYIELCIKNLEFKNDIQSPLTLGEVVNLIHICDGKVDERTIIRLLKMAYQHIGFVYIKTRFSLKKEYYKFKNSLQSISVDFVKSSIDLVKFHYKYADTYDYFFKLEALLFNLCFSTLQNLNPEEIKEVTPHYLSILEIIYRLMPLGVLFVEDQQPGKSHEEYIDWFYLSKYLGSKVLEESTRDLFNQMSNNGRILFSGMKPMIYCLTELGSEVPVITQDNIKRYSRFFCETKNELKMWVNILSKKNIVHLDLDRIIVWLENKLCRSYLLSIPMVKESIINSAKFSGIYQKLRDNFIKENLEGEKLLKVLDYFMENESDEILIEKSDSVYNAVCKIQVKKNPDYSLFQKVLKYCKKVGESFDSAVSALLFVTFTKTMDRNPNYSIDFIIPYFCDSYTKLKHIIEVNSLAIIPVIKYLGQNNGNEEQSKNLFSSLVYQRGDFILILYSLRLVINLDDIIRRFTPWLLNPKDLSDFSRLPLIAGLIVRMIDFKKFYMEGFFQQVIKIEDRDEFFLVFERFTIIHNFIFPRPGSEEKPFYVILSDEDVEDIHRYIVSKVLEKWKLNTVPRIKNIMKYFQSIGLLDPQMQRGILDRFISFPKKKPLVKYVIKHDIKSLYFLTDPLLTGFKYTYNPVKKEFILQDTIISAILRWLYSVQDEKLSNYLNYALVSKQFLKVSIGLFSRVFNGSKYLEFETEKKLFIGREWSLLRDGIGHCSYWGLSNFHFTQAEEVFYRLTSLDIKTHFEYTVNRNLPNLIQLSFEYNTEVVDLPALINLFKYCTNLQQFKLVIKFSPTNEEFPILYTVLSRLFRYHSTNLLQFKLVYQPNFITARFRKLLKIVRSNLLIPESKCKIFSSCNFSYEDITDRQLKSASNNCYTATVGKNLWYTDLFKDGYFKRLRSLKVIVGNLDEDSIDKIGKLVNLHSLSINCKKLPCSVINKIFAKASIHPNIQYLNLYRKDGHILLKPKVTYDLGRFQILNKERTHFKKI
ncbi:coronin binding protein [Tieghemostelium lacteum]|uniref:Coronin binding protein n=1 Tax=Tieghemostelium lacteum TaxID=361077 RepID=A0A151ZIS9_TIELA|nr:coronin binding protein [Tieghemostelium lacteum]|eukprot:KYQ93873.1 coronin binding protein [Tieghemostelium lacteum]